jgi:hypothetical protein
VEIVVQVQGAPEIVVTDSGDSVSESVKRELADTLRTTALTPQAQVLKTCLAIMRFMGGTVLVTNFPLNTSKLTLEFAPAADGMIVPGERMRASDF